MDLMKEGVIEKRRVDPLAQLSLYGKSNDRFWFTLFHETAHILLHGKEKKAMLHNVGREVVYFEFRNVDFISGLACDVCIASL